MKCLIEGGVSTRSDSNTNTIKEKKYDRIENVNVGGGVGTIQ